MFGSFIGIGVLVGLLYNRPDGLLHIIFCDVGQGDAMYLKFPNGTDMLIDGGPNQRVLACLSKHMPFYDRKIDIVALTHPEKDHYFGLGAVLDRYTVGYFASIPVANTSGEYKQFLQKLREVQIQQRYLTTGEEVRIGDVTMHTLWPDREWLKLNLKDSEVYGAVDQVYESTLPQVSQTDLDLNAFSLYLHLRYKDFDILFTGDGGSQTQDLLSNLSIPIPASIEVFKFPHHGSKTGISESFLSIIKPDLTIIEVGKNSYGHPHPLSIQRLKPYGKTLTTQEGSIEVVSNGSSWWVRR